jgi:hypothetical protein
VGRRYRVQLVIKEGGCPRGIIEKTSFRLQAEMRSLLGRGGGGEIALGLAMLERAKRALHIESTSVTQRHHAEGMPLPRREPWPGKDSGELDNDARN